MWRSGGSNETDAEVLVEKFSESHLFGLGKGIDCSWQRCGAVFQVDFQVVRAVWSKNVGSGFAEYVSELVVIGGDVLEVNLRARRGGVGGHFGENEVHRERLRSR